MEQPAARTADSASDLRQTSIHTVWTEIIGRYLVHRASTRACPGGMSTPRAAGPLIHRQVVVFHRIAVRSSVSAASTSVLAVTRATDREILRLAVPGVPGPGRRAAVPARRRRRRGPPRHRRAGRARHRRGGPADRRRPVRLPRLRHHRRRRPAARRRRPARRAGPGPRRDLAGGRARRRLITVVGVALTGPLVGAFGVEADGRGATPPPTCASRFLGTAPLLRHARRDRRAPRPAGHPHARWSSPSAATLSTSSSTSCSSTASVRRRPRHRRVGAGARSSPRSPRPPRWSWVVVRGARRHGASLRPDLAGRPGGRARRGGPGGAHADAARRAAA